MGTEILHPQDILVERLRFTPPSFSPRRKQPFAGNYCNLNSNPKSYRKQDRRRNSPPSPPTVAPSTKSETLVSKKPTVEVDSSKPAKNFALGQVKILKRGETLDFDFETKDEIISQKNGNLKKSFSGDLQSLVSKKENETLKKTFSGDLLLCGTERLGPDPELVPIRLSELKPLSFRSDVYAGSAFALSPSPRALPLPKFSLKKEGVDDSATKDLIRLLRIG